MPAKTCKNAQPTRPKVVEISSTNPSNGGFKKNETSFVVKIDEIKCSLLILEYKSIYNLLV